ncbi:mCG1029167, partial [Mus musculus]
KIKTTLISPEKRIFQSWLLPRSRVLIPWFVVCESATAATAFPRGPVQAIPLQGLRVFEFPDGD